MQKTGNINIFVVLLTQKLKTKIEYGIEIIIMINTGRT